MILMEVDNDIRACGYKTVKQQHKSSTLYENARQNTHAHTHTSTHTRKRKE